MELKKESIFIIGATSDVAKATAEKYASQGFDLLLCGRNSEALSQLAANYKIRYEVSVDILVLDITETQSHSSLLMNLESLPYTTIVFAGYLGDQIKAQSDWDESRTILETNFTGVVSVCNILAEKYEQRRFGTLAVLSSVAGERGRQSNYLYGSAKAGLTAYLSGLRNRLSKSKVHVVSIIPGYMATKMTEEMQLPGALTLKPEQAAQAIYRAVEKKKNVVYIKGIWRLIMFIIKSIPEIVFKKLNL